MEVLLLPGGGGKHRGTNDAGAPNRPIQQTAYGAGIGAS
jgi:hypothetical protein